MGFALFLIFVGLMILLSSLGLMSLTFGRVVSVFFAIFFAVSGLKSIFKRGFPSGLVSISLAVILVLYAFDIVTFGFWKIVGILIAVFFIEIGLRILTKGSTHFSNFSHWEDFF